MSNNPYDQFDSEAPQARQAKLPPGNVSGHGSRAVSALSLTSVRGGRRAQCVVGSRWRAWTAAPMAHIRFAAPRQHGSIARQAICAGQSLLGHMRRARSATSRALFAEISASRRRAKGAFDPERTFKIGPSTGGIGEEAEPQLRRWLRPGTAVPAAATNDPTQRSQLESAVWDRTIN